MRITKGIQVTGSSKHHYWLSDSPNIEMRSYPQVQRKCKNRKTRQLLRLRNSLCPKQMRNQALSIDCI